MLVRDFTCALCGAPRKVATRALVVLCVHCGAVMTFAGETPSAADAHAAGVRQLVKPSAAQARLLAERATVDPALPGRLEAYAAAAAELTQGDPVEAAKEMLAAARTYFAGSDHLAKDMVRSAIGGYASLLGVGAIERIRIEVLGDTASATCSRCGGPLAAGTTACRHCGAVATVSTEDAWLAAQLDLWAITRADLVRRGELHGPGVVVSAVGAFFWTSTVPAESAATFLRLAIPWVTREQLTSGLDVLRYAANEAQRARLEQLRAELAGWTTSADPPKHVPTEIADPSPEDEAAWVASALARYRYRGGPLAELLGQCLSTMQIAAVHEIGAGLSPRAAMDLFARAKPDYDRAEMLALLEPLIPGYDHPRVRRFTTELAALLRTTG